MGLGQALVVACGLMVSTRHRPPEAVPYRINQDVDLFIFITDREADICFSVACDLLSTIGSRRPQNRPRHQEKRSRDCSDDAKFRRAKNLTGCHHLHWVWLNLEKAADVIEPRFIGFRGLSCMAQKLGKEMFGGRDASYSIKKASSGSR
ncbi:uncharacterized protein LOC133737939 [Rosa rugosa]|uniref:uncharacterized protein LOC133737939 n=1 Tax=Rosa rugosa TaxID=74645 RepID=UPI002B416A38|nr:uncharacterized protein LOC133737939 [Rosa rugosa]